MKTAIKLILIYFLMQIVGTVAAAPFGAAYTYITYGTLDLDKTKVATICLSLLFGFIFMGVYLWKKKYLTGDKRLYSFVSPSYLAWSMLAGISAIFLIDFLMSYLAFLPNWLESGFEILQAGWLGIISIAVLGPVLEELLFRGAVTKALLEKYNPAKAIFISGMLFGIFHLNPAQVVAACLFGFLFAWLYYRTGSLMPGILIHVLNNSLAVWLSMNYAEADTMSQVLDKPVYWSCLAVSALLLLLSLKRLDSYKKPL